MNKKELTQAAAAKSNLSKKVIRQALSAITDTINETLEKKESIVLQGFGTFSVKKRAARNGINPVTKKAIVIPEMEVVKFRVSSKKSDNK